jgi:hypothetical protein
MAAQCAIWLLTSAIAAGRNSQEIDTADTAQTFRRCWVNRKFADSYNLGMS